MKNEEEEIEKDNRFVTGINDTKIIKEFDDYIVYNPPPVYGGAFFAKDLNAINENYDKPLIPAEVYKKPKINYWDNATINLKINSDGDYVKPEKIEYHNNYGEKIEPDLDNNITVGKLQDAPISQKKAVKLEVKQTLTEYLTQRIQEKDGGNISQFINEYTYNEGNISKTQEPIIMKKDTKYRVLLSKDNDKLNYIVCPKDYNGTDKELLDIALRGENRDIKIIPYIPQFDKNGKEIPPKKKQSRIPTALRPVVADVAQIPVSVFIEKTNHLFDQEITAEEFAAIYNNMLNLETRSIIRTYNTQNSTIIANHILFDRQSQTYGITTGKLIENEIEVINLTNPNNRYTIRTSFRYNRFDINNIESGNSSRFLNFFRIKLQNSPLSKVAFGGGIATRKKLDGKLVGSNTTRIQNNFSNKVGERYPIVIETLDSNGSNYIYYLPEEVKIFMIDPKKLSGYSVKKNKQIQTNNKALIKDDRRLNTLKRGDTVIVEKIIKNVNKGLSTAIIIDNLGKKQTILLKQLRPYAESDKKISGESTIKSTSKKSEQTNIFDVSKAEGSKTFNGGTERVKERIAKKTAFNSGILF